MSRRALLALAAVLFVLGAWLRLDQLSYQVLLDDEWHAVHQLLSGKGPGEMFFTMGHADYSIPLGLLYWLEAQLFGLSELLMRWPMIVAGLLSLLLFPCYALRHYSLPTAVILLFFLAVSPMLVIYTHTARPYALTLLLSYLGLYTFYRYYGDGLSHKLLWGVCYSLCAALTIWLHPIAGPFVIAPFLLEGGKALSARCWPRLLVLLKLAIPSGVLSALLVLPPLLGDPQALSGKAGLAAVHLDTVIGVWFMWLGTPSTLCVVALLLLAIIGMPRLLRDHSLVQSAILGLLLTLAAIVLTQPAWVNHSLTFGRYLLPAVPLLLLAAALGVVHIGRWLSGATALRRVLAGSMMVALTALYLLESPVWLLAARPNSNANHSAFQFSFRPAHNATLEYQENLPRSLFWETLAQQPRNSLRVAVAPFYFETYNWDAPRWEVVSGQRVVPAYLRGYCLDRRFGEVPADSRFRFSNALYVSELVAGLGDRPDWLVFNRPFRGYVNGKENQMVGADTRHCLRQLRTEMGPPDYRDDHLIAYKLTKRRE